MELTLYSALLEDIKSRIRKAQIKATFASSLKVPNKKQLEALKFGRKGWNKGKKLVDGKYIIP